VVLPALIPALSAGTTLTALYVLADFGVVRLLRYRTFVTAIYEQMSGRYDYATASSLSLVLLLVTFLMLVGQEKLRNRNAQAPQVTSHQLPKRKLGNLRWPALGLVIGILTIGFALPVSILTHWQFRALADPETTLRWGTSTATLIQSGFTSLGTSAMAATLAVALTIPLAYWIVRSPLSKWGKGLSWISQAGITLPGVLIALGLALTFKQIHPALTFSLLAMVCAYLIHYFGQAFQTIRSGLTQIPQQLEEESRLLGCSPLQAFWRVVRPTLQPALLAGWMLVFFSSMRELPASLLLRPAGFDTLTVRVWIAASEGFYAQAAAPALWLVVISLPLVFVLLQPQNRSLVRG